MSRWRVADHLATDEELSLSELAQKCKVPEQVFTPIIRQAMSKHIFKESRKGYVAHTAASRLFIGSVELNDYISIALDDIWPSAAHMLNALEKWDYSQEANHTVIINMELWRRELTVTGVQSRAQHAASVL